MSEHHPPNWRTAFFLSAFLFAAVQGTGSTMLAGLETRITRELSVGHTQTGLAQSALFLGHLVGFLLMPILMNRHSPRACALGSIGLLVIGNAVTGVPHVAALVAGRCLFGLGSASGALYFSTVFVYLFTSRQAKWLNLYHAALGLSCALTLATAAMMGEWLGSWTRVFHVATALSLLPGIALATARVPPLKRIDPAQRPSSDSRWRSLWGSPRLVSALAFAVCYSLAEASLTAFITTHVETTTNVASSQAARVATLLCLGTVVGRLLSSLARDRVSESAQLCIGTIVGGALVVAALLTGDGRLIQPLAFAAGIAIGPNGPLLFSLVSRAAPGMKESAMGLLGAAQCIGGMGIILVGLAGDHLSLRSGIAAAFVLAIASLAPLMTTNRRSRLPAERDDQPSEPSNLTR